MLNDSIPIKMIRLRSMAPKDSDADIREGIFIPLEKFPESLHYPKRSFASRYPIRFLAIMLILVHLVLCGIFAMVCLLSF